MPSPDQILAGLTSIANEWRSVAIVWHVVLALSLLAILVGWRPSARVSGYALVTPLVSVAAAAFTSGNPFNGVVFTTLLLVFASLASRLSREPIRVGEPHVVAAGVMLVGFGAAYPHFVETNGWSTYVYAAPLGLLPCPTLSAVMGASLTFGLFDSRPWAFTLAAAGSFYGAVGAVALDVKLDYVLLAGALVVVASVFR